MNTLLFGTCGGNIKNFKKIPNGFMPDTINILFVDDFDSMEKSNQRSPKKKVIIKTKQ